MLDLQKFSEKEIGKSNTICTTSAVRNMWDLTVGAMTYSYCRRATCLPRGHNTLKSAEELPNVPISVLQLLPRQISRTDSTDMSPISSSTHHGVLRQKSLLYRSTKVALNHRTPGSLSGFRLLTRHHDEGASVSVSSRFAYKAQFQAQRSNSH